TASSGTGSSGGEGGGGTKIEPKPPLPEIVPKPTITKPPITGIIEQEIKPKPVETITGFYERIKATKEEKTILKTLEEKIKVEAYPSKVNNLQVIRFRNTLFIPIEDFIFIINAEKPSFNIKVLGNKNLINKAIIKEINKIANGEIKKIKEEYNKIIKNINEEYKKKINELKKTIKDKILLNYKIKELTKERDKKLKEEKSLLGKASGKGLKEKIKDLLEERDKLIDELKKKEPVICPPLEIHNENWCKDGKIVPGKKDARGCKLPDKCVKCPVWLPKQCKGGGKLVPGGFDQNGCKAPDRCVIEGSTTTSTSSTSTSTSSTSTSSTTIPGIIVTTTSTSTSSSTTTISGIGMRIIEGEISTDGSYQLHKRVNETVLYFSEIISESDRNNITIEELGLGEYEEEKQEEVYYKGIYNLILFIIIILILLY
ncbi:MAG: hypothetical protein AABX29_10085, partial [Nanoarchaeota archaeon]